MIGLNADWKLTTTAYAHQRAAIEKLSRLRVGALFMDMGTGKTRTALELVWLRRKRIAKCGWCCPVCVSGENFRRENAAQKMDKLKTLMEGKERR